jgi:hypothetical protein
MNNFYHARRYMGRDLNPISVEYGEQVLNNAPRISVTQRRLCLHQVVPRYVKKKDVFYTCQRQSHAGDNNSIKDFRKSRRGREHR